MSASGSETGPGDVFTGARGEGLLVFRVGEEEGESVARADGGGLALGV